MSRSALKGKSKERATAFATFRGCSTDFERLKNDRGYDKMIYKDTTKEAKISHIIDDNGLMVQDFSWKNATISYTKAARMAKKYNLEITGPPKLEQYWSLQKSQEKLKERNAAYQNLDTQMNLQAKKQKLDVQDSTGFDQRMTNCKEDLDILSANYKRDSDILYANYKRDFDMVITKYLKNSNRSPQKSKRGPIRPQTKQKNGNANFDMSQKKRNSDQDFQEIKENNKILNNMLSRFGEPQLEVPNDPIILKCNNQEDDLKFAFQQLSSQQHFPNINFSGSISPFLNTEKENLDQNLFVKESISPHYKLFEEMDYMKSSENSRE